MSGIAMKNKATLSLTSESYSSLRNNLIHVFGRRNPDSDAICSALIVADWLNYTGRPAPPCRRREITPETHYILYSAGVSRPDLLTADLTDKTAWLVDLMDVELGLSSLMDSNVIGIIDHYHIGTLITRNPSDFWVRAVGRCGTVILPIQMYENPMPYTATHAVLLMGAILSDTVALRGPPTTSQDQSAVDVLHEIAGVDYEQFLTGSFRTKTDITGQSALVLLHRDAKNYRIHDVPLLLSQIDVRDINDITPQLPCAAAGNG